MSDHGCLRLDSSVKHSPSASQNSRECVVLELPDFAVMWPVLCLLATLKNNDFLSFPVYICNHIHAQGQSKPAANVQVSIMMSTPAHQVFNTTELIELVLLQLPVREVLLGQRVSKQWQDTVLGSTKLQQALFQRHKLPISNNACGRGYILNYNDPKLAHLDFGRPPQFAKYPWHLSSAEEIRTAAMVAEEPLTNPLLTRVFARLPDILFEDRSVALIRFQIGGAGPTHDRNDQSWRRMFVIQPPVTCMAVIRHHREQPGRREFESPVLTKFFPFVTRPPAWNLPPNWLYVLTKWCSMITNAEGVTIGDLVDFAEKKCEPGLHSCVDFTWVT